ncbi:hypothetical protein RIF29_00546 [Crotalaria pallida]|uniref:DOMON domain-containing protein n=1 Tax=Crotalaria pallida TaxID=3830 RepID=A0AAN9P6K2_CROPI
MASFPFSPLILGILISLFSPTVNSAAVTCATHKIPQNRTFENCTNLPILGVTLHHTYTAVNRSLSIAFGAESPKDNGWVSWGINPSGGKMLGAGAVIASKFNGKITVDTYNLSNIIHYVKPENLSFEVWDISAVDLNGVITILASVKLPEKNDNLTQVWQVGPLDNKGEIKLHALEPENMKAVAPLKVAAAAATSPSSSATAPSPSEHKHKNGGVRMMGEKLGLGFYLGFVLVLLGFISM